MVYPTCFAALLALSSFQSPVAPQPRDAVFGEAAPTPVEIADDRPPLPVPAQWSASAGGDVLVSARSGDPYFLGFSSGRYFPPQGERVDPDLGVLAAANFGDGRPSRSTYAFVMFERRMTAERFDVLRRNGCRVLEFHPHYCVKVAIDLDSIEAVGSLDFVRWVGLAEPSQKLDGGLPAAVSALEPGEKLPVFLNVFESDLCADSVALPVGLVQESDGENVVAGPPEARGRITLSNGWQQRRLEQLGVRVLEYIDSVQAFVAEIEPWRLEELAALDFVQFVEPRSPGELFHDESMAMINADRTRASYDGGTNSAAVVGVLDTGCDIGHAALDPYIVGWDFTAENAGPFSDGCEHGSHVCGTVFGNEDVEDSYQGVAPGLGYAQDGRVFFGRMGESDCSLSYSFSSITSAFHSSYTDGSSNTTPRPMAVSCSWGNNSTAAYGTDTHARTWDAEVFDYDQLYVFATGNSGPTPGTLGLQPAAKNILGVGSVYDWENGNDPGALVNSSGRGPTADGRWKPNVCAPGNSIRSCDANSTTGYTNKSGTSMATPHVTGLAAQLCDHYSFLRYRPAVVSAVLMAAATTKDNALLAGPGTSSSHYNTYGTGRVDAYRSHYGDSEQALYFWSASLGWTDSTYVEFPVNSGATRLTVVVHYKEIEASSGASQALISDFDSFIDASPFAAGNNSGDYTAQQSSVDNTEVRMLSNPTATDWRVKIYPTSVLPFSTTKVGICVIVTYGDTTPTPTFNVSTSDAYVNTGDDVTLTAFYYAPSFLASAVFLDQTSSGNVMTASYGTLVDGSTANWLTNAHSGRDVELGDVVHDTSRVANWTVHWTTEGAKTFQVQARSDNATDVTDTVTVYVDDTPPALPTNLISTTHTPNVWTNDASITYSWTASTDNLSGVDGYGIFTTTLPAIPGAVKDIEQVTTYSETLAQGSWYFNLRPVDNSGNWNASYASVGPFRIDLTSPGTPSNVSSPTHPVGVQQCTTLVTVNWTAATDNAGGSGLGGYVATINQIPGWNPPGPANVPANQTSFSMDIGSIAGPRYIHVRAIDVAGNLGTTVHVGPIYANANSVATYCTGKTNSLGCVPAIGSSGAPSLGGGAFTVTCSNALNQKNGLLFWGFTPSATPFQGGTKCVASPTVRGPTTNSGGSASGNDCSGTYSFNFSTAYMNSVGLVPGNTLYTQWWTRDPASPSTTGLSNALQFTVCE